MYNYSVARNYYCELRNYTITRGYQQQLQNSAHPLVGKACNASAFTVSQRLVTSGFQKGWQGRERYQGRAIFQFKRLASEFGLNRQTFLKRKMSSLTNWVTEWIVFITCLLIGSNMTNLNMLAHIQVVPVYWCSRIVACT